MSAWNNSEFFKIIPNAVNFFFVLMLRLCKRSDLIIFTCVKPGRFGILSRFDYLRLIYGYEFFVNDVWKDIFANDICTFKYTLHHTYNLN